MNTIIKTVDDLTFTSRNEHGVISWWNVEPPKQVIGLFILIWVAHTRLSF